MRLVDVGMKGDQSTEIITSTETAPDSGTDGTSIYIVRFSGEDGLYLNQLQGTSPVPYDPIAKGEGGPSGQGPQIARRIDWVIGLGVEGKYSLARLYNFKMAAA
jgi:hypothetical protein